MKTKKALLSIVLSPFLAMLFISSLQAGAGDDGVGEYGGYISNEESRFTDYVWDFIDELKHDCDTCPLGVCLCTDWVSSWINEKYTNTQYLWGSCAQLRGSSLSYVDSVDLAYVAGHGSPHKIKMSKSETSSCDLSLASWGSYATNGPGDLESIVFHSCKVLSMDGTWRNYWKRSSATASKPFSGLRHAMGFKTNHNNGIGAGAWTSDEFAEELEEGNSVRNAWYEAVEDGYWLSPWAVIVEGENKQAIFFIRPNKNETMSNLYSGGAGDFNYGNSNYLLDATHRN